MTIQTQRRLKRGARGTRPWPLLIALLAVAVAGASFVLADLTGPDQEGAPAGVPASSDPSDSSGSTGSGSVGTAGVFAGVTTADFALGDDPVGDGADLACSRFREGDTVLEFATWFEAEVKLGPAEQQELFQSIVVRALTESCPEVVAGD